ncbi:hypothetical protein F4679DRAFT_565687, partial [Xylaria curta]
MVPFSRSRIPDASVGPKQEPESDNDFSFTELPTIEQPTIREPSTQPPTIKQPTGKQPTRASVVLIPEYSFDPIDEGYEGDVNEGVTFMGSKRTRFQKQPGTSSAERLGSMNKEPSSSKQDITPRKRGRPAKNSLSLSSANMSATTSTTKSSASRRKRGVAKSSLRRSSRTAAESATKQITEQSVSFPCMIWKSIEL